tara:strand:+ start:11075 stop:11398 length:324 start_codon:yes stop_codon:yes gene_type:complete
MRNTINKKQEESGMASYMVGVVTKHNLEKYAEYAAAGFALIDGVKVEVGISDNPETHEGEFPGTSIIIMKFADDGAARDWYLSEGYQEVIPLRHAAADTAFVITFDS